MSISTGILRTQLSELEKNAETLERIVLKELNELENRINSKDIVILEAKILSKLRNLDDIQDEIESITAKLKDAGEWQPNDYSEAKYIYKRPKVKAAPKPKPKKERKPRKVYPVESPTPAKLRAKREAEKLAKQAEREAARAANRPTPKPKAVRPPKPKAVKPPKPKPEPKPRKPAESYEMKLAKKRRDKALKALENLDAQIEAERLNVERRLEERKARVLEVADAVELGPQKRLTARKALENVEQQLRDLNIRKIQRAMRLAELIDIANEQIEQLQLAN